jgi:hypothetical protein
MGGLTRQMERRDPRAELTFRKLEAPDYTRPRISVGLLDIDLVDTTADFEGRRPEIVARFTDELTSRLLAQWPDASIRIEVAQSPLPYSAKYPFGQSLPNGVTIEHLPAEMTVTETKRAEAIRDGVIAASRVWLRR